MISRRQFILMSALLFAQPLATSAAESVSTDFKGSSIFERIVEKAAANKWASRDIGDLVGAIALELNDTPYVAGTLEISPDHEICSANLTGLDCVTFFETSLDMARMLKKGEHSQAALLSQIEFTRYRGGRMSDYTSRLHYTSDWFFDNEKKHVVRLLSNLPGAAPFHPHVGFMTEHPQSYPQLAKHPDLIPRLRAFENEINKRTMTFVPISKIPEAQKQLKTGDIVGICSDIPGLDITHTGLIVCDKNGIPRFMNASSKKGTMKVEVNPADLQTALSGSPHNIGAMFARPIFER